MSSRLFTFVGGAQGPWMVDQVRSVVGESLPAPAALQMVDGVPASSLAEGLWSFTGITSNERYVERSEKIQLIQKQEGLGRPHATCGALIPIRKSAAWWAMTQDERRAVFEAQSHHTQVGLKYLPGIARRLHHCRDLSPDAPFDFLTWFEFAPSEQAAFDQLLVELRRTPEWSFVEREVEIRVSTR